MSQRVTPGGTPGKRPPAPLPSSPQATQHPSSGSLLTQIQNQHLPQYSGTIFRNIEAWFINRTVKKEYIDAIKTNFRDNALKAKWDPIEALRVWNNHFLPLLTESSFEDLAFYEVLLSDPQAIKFSQDNLIIKPNSLLTQAFATLPKVARLTGALRVVDQLEYLKIWVENASELNERHLGLLLKSFTSHLDFVTTLQNRRPEVFDQDSAETKKLINNFRNQLNQPYSKQANRLLPYSSVLEDATVIRNRQILMASIASQYMGITNKKDSQVPELVARSVGTSGRAPPFSTYNQVATPLPFPAGNDETLIEDFQATSEVYLTHPFTMETRVVRLPLPIKGAITIGDAKKQLELLKTFVKTPNEFDETYNRLQLKGDREGLRQSFITFSKEWNTQWGHALGDFNSTSLRPKETSARGQPVYDAAITNPTSQAYAIKAAAGRNLFLLSDGTLSLIPSGPGEQHKAIGTLSPEERRDATRLLLGDTKGRPASIKVPEKVADDAELKSATLSLQFSEMMVDEDIPYLVLDTTIALGDKIITRRTYYERRFVNGQFESLDDSKNRIRVSGFFNRDILLAKSTFIEKLVHEAEGHG